MGRTMVVLVAFAIPWWVDTATVKTNVLIPVKQRKTLFNYMSITAICFIAPRQCHTIRPSIRRCPISEVGGLVILRIGIYSGCHYKLPQAPGVDWEIKFNADLAFQVDTVRKLYADVWSRLIDKATHHQQRL